MESTILGFVLESVQEGVGQVPSVLCFLTIVEIGHAIPR